MPSETPRFIALDEVLLLHETSIMQFGGTQGIRDIGLVDSALASAINTFLYADGTLFDIAAAYAFHLAENQAFLDGNKRTSLKTALAFLRANGVKAGFNEPRLYELMIDIANRRLDKAGLARALRQMANAE